MIDQERNRQQQQTAEQQRTRRHHHRVIFGQPQPEDRGAGKGDGGEQDHHLGQDIAAETTQRIETDDDRVPAEPKKAPASFSSVAGSCRVMAQVIRKAKIGVVEASTTVGAAATYCCAQVIIRNGTVELMVCCCANSFQALASVGSRIPRMYRTTRRKSAAISERAEMKVIGGIEPRPILVSG